MLAHDEPKTESHNPNLPDREVHGAAWEEAGFDHPYEQDGHREPDNKHLVVGEVCFPASLDVVAGEVDHEHHTTRRYRQDSHDHVLLEFADAASEDRPHGRERMLALVRTRV